MRFGTFLCVGLLGLSVSFSSFSRSALADSAEQSSDVTARLQQVDDATLRDAGIEQAQQIRQLPNKLRAQGIELSPEQEQLVQQKADDLAIQASQPDFRRKVRSSMKKFGIETLKIVGYTGNLAVAVTLAPPDFVVSFIESLFTGHGIDESAPPETRAGASQAIGAGYILIDVLFYQAAGSAAIGVMTGSMADLIVSAILCQNHNEAADHSELGQYCHENWTLMKDVLRPTADAGVDAGGEIHHGILHVIHCVAHAIGHVFHHTAKSAPAATATEPATVTGGVLN